MAVFKLKQSSRHIQMLQHGLAVGQFAYQTIKDAAKMLRSKHLPKVRPSNLFYRSKSTRVNSQLRKEELFLRIPLLTLASLVASTVTFFAGDVYGVLTVQHTEHCFKLKAKTQYVQNQCP